MSKDKEMLDLRAIACEVLIANLVKGHSAESVREAGENLASLWRAGDMAAFGDACDKIIWGV